MRGGEPGWSHEMCDDRGHKVTLKKYLKKMLFCHGPQLGKLGRLFNEYCCDMYSRLEDNKLDYYRHNLQKRIASRRELSGARSAGDASNVGKVYMPANHPGSYRQMRNCMQNAFALLRQRGRPNYFITVTCNPRWTEIASRLEPGQTAADRPDLVCRVFHERLKRFKRWIMSGKSPFGKIEYFMHVVEFQKRGLPHAHILLRNENGPTADDLRNVDDIIQVELPEDPKLRSLVEEFMIHSHTANCTLSDGTCKYNYPKPNVEATHVDERGYVQHKRSGTNNAYVVAFNGDCLRFMNCHVNVEVAATAAVISYLFKYFYKGHDKARFAASASDSKTPRGPQEKRSAGAEHDDTDEIQQYLSARYVSASEAVWRILGFRTYEFFPTVKTLPVHLPGEDSLVFEHGNEDDVLDAVPLLDRYFARPTDAQFDDILYEQYFCDYAVSTTKPRGVPGINYWIDAHATAPRYIHRISRGERIARLHFAALTERERFFLRYLLMHHSARSYVDLRTVAGVTYGTYQEAAQACGLKGTQAEAEEAMKELANGPDGRVGRDLRSALCTLLLSTEMNVTTIVDAYYRQLTADLSGSRREVWNAFLADMKDKLERMGTSLRSVRFSNAHSTQQQNRKAYNNSNAVTC